MSDRDDTADAAASAADELTKKRARTRAARASRNKIVDHIAQLTAPCTLYRMNGSGGGKANRMWICELRDIPTVTRVQKKYGGGRFVVIDCTGNRFAFNLAALPDEPEPAPEPEQTDRGPAPRAYGVPGGAAPAPGPRFDPMTGRPLHPPAPIPQHYDPHTGRPLPPGWGFTIDPYSGRAVAQPVQRPLPVQPQLYAPPPHQPQGESSAIRLLIDEVRAIRSQALERPIPAASDFGGQMTAMFTAFDLLDKMKSRFSPDKAAGDDEDEPAWMAMVERFLPMVMPQAGGTPPPPALAAPAPQPNPLSGSPPAAAHEPLTALEVQSARQMLAQLTAINPGMTLEKLCELGERSGISHRQSVHLFHGVMGILNGTTQPAETDDGFEDEDEYSYEEESWSEEESQQERNYRAPEEQARRDREQETPAAPTPAASPSPAPPSSGPESMPAGPKPASGPLDSSPPLPNPAMTRATG